MRSFEGENENEAERRIRRVAILVLAVGIGLTLWFTLEERGSPPVVLVPGAESPGLAIAVAPLPAVTAPVWHESATMAALPVPAADPSATPGVQEASPERPNGLRIRVVDGETGEPVAGARVGAFREGADRKRLFVTEDDGWATVNGIGPGRIQIEASHGGYLGVAIGAQVRDAGGRIEVDLTEAMCAEGAVVSLLRAREIAGRVLDPHWGAVKGACVAARHKSGNVQTVSTDEHGRFRLRGVRAGKLLVIATHPDWAAGWRAVELAKGRAVADVEVMLSEPASLAGRVRGTDGRSIAGAQVEARPIALEGPTPQRTWNDPWSAVWSTATTGADGSYAMARVSAGALHLIARAPRYRSSATAAVEARAGTTTVVDFALEAGGTIAGRIVSADGRPIVAGGSVFVHREGSEDSRADLDGGVFEVHGLQEGLYDLHVGIDGYTRFRLEDVAPGTTDLVVKLERTCRVVGRVILPPSGPPVPGVAYLVRSESGGTRSAAHVDDDGRFTIDEVEPDALSISLTFPGYPTHLLEALKLEAGEDLDVVIRLDVGGIVTGTIHDESGKPVVGACVTVWRGAALPAAADCESDAHGRFRFIGAPSGLCRIRVVKRSATADGQVSVVAGAEVDAGVIVIDREK